ncbi:MAG: polyamine aminopropyltransferase [Candidatus Competibacteraceae bacterium]|nr:polyamine aminopropyltransferase [Candidatus Competibacteraceae bacterium]MBK7983717.1 polyamine aminopropyltransferase [Candidatus Competibacteraceae bacterium]MBK8897741.1 polyamine aminopropyltransferase [Candidatus Competibacteraceae bacterium]MBK8961546.1 polyamine aminopropyltransferase [Candidatus Competibacteraceae bacterium]MBK9950772.1 polyamine aminopropyltransferase [Candidatus Competibacteraceae bacterium]
MTLDHSWFSEIHPATGSAFSLKLEGKLHDVWSPHQHIAVYATAGFGNLLVIDGYIMLTSRDNFLYHEMMAHPALFTHPNPRRVLIVGGGDCGTLREALKHPGIETVVQIDIDRAVTDAAERYFPELCAANGDPRAQLRFDDGLAWVKNAGAGAYEVIIVDSTDPIGPAEGLFAEPFFRDCHRALSADGVLVQQSESPLFHLDSILLPLHRNLRAAGFADTHTLHFPQCGYPSGWWSATLARKAGRVADFREADAAAKAFATDYYNADIHRAALAIPEFMRRALAGL